MILHTLAPWCLVWLRLYPVSAHTASYKRRKKKRQSRLKLWTQRSPPPHRVKLCVLTADRFLTKVQLGARLEQCRSMLTTLKSLVRWQAAGLSQVNTTISRLRYITIVWKKAGMTIMAYGQWLDRKYSNKQALDYELLCCTTGPDEWACLISRLWLPCYIQLHSPEQVTCFCRIVFHQKDGWHHIQVAALWSWLL